MKKITTLLLCICFAGMLCACDGDSSSSSQQEQTKQVHYETVKQKETRSFYWDDSAVARSKADAIKDKYFDKDFNQVAGIRNGKPITTAKRK